MKTITKNQYDLLASMHSWRVATLALADQRTVRSLVNRGYLARNEDSGFYRITWTGDQIFK